MKNYSHCVGSAAGFLNERVNKCQFVKSSVRLLSRPSCNADDSSLAASDHSVSFIHSGYFYSAFSSPLLLRGAPDTARILCRSFASKRHRQLWVKDFPKVPTWRLERNSNPRPFGRKTMTLPMSHHRLFRFQGPLCFSSVCLSCPSICASLLSVISLFVYFSALSPLLFPFPLPVRSLLSVSISSLFLLSSLPSLLSSLCPPLLRTGPLNSLYESLLSFLSPLSSVCSVFSYFSLSLSLSRSLSLILSLFLSLSALYFCISLSSLSLLLSSISSSLPSLLSPLSALWSSSRFLISFPCIVL